MAERSEVNITLKYALFTANFLFLIVGGAMWSLGTWSLAMDPVTIRTVIDFLFNPRIIILMVIGIGTFLIAFFGCCGSLREIIVFLKCYHITISILLGIELIVIIAFFVFAFVPDVMVQLDIYPEQKLKDAMIKYSIDKDQTEFVDWLQQTFECCGASNDDKGYLDWNSNEYFNCTAKAYSYYPTCGVPFTCCVLEVGKLNDLTCGANALDPTKGNNINIHKKGCFKGILDFLRQNLYIILGITLGILLPQIIFIHFAKNLNSQIKQQMAKWRRSQYAQNFER